MHANDLLACRDLCLEYLRSVVDHDWSSSIPDLDGDISDLVAHVAGATLWYAVDLAAGGDDVDAIFPQVKTNGGPQSLIAALDAAAALLALAIQASPDDVRGFHPFGQADPSGFAAIACDEMIVHTHDISRGLGIDFSPSTELASKVLHRLFPWATAADDDPWVALQWANGRIALGDRERLTKWRWHCAPLSEWDGQQPGA